MVHGESALRVCWGWMSEVAAVYSCLILFWVVGFWVLDRRNQQGNALNRENSHSLFRFKRYLLVWVIKPGKPVTPIALHPPNPALNDGFVNDSINWFGKHFEPFGKEKTIQDVTSAHVSELVLSTGTPHKHPTSGKS